MHTGEFAAIIEGCPPIARSATNVKDGLVIGQPAHFRFVSSAVRKQDRAGDVLSCEAEDELAETDSLEATLPADGLKDEYYVPAKFHSKVTELGMFALCSVG